MKWVLIGGAAIVATIAVGIAVFVAVYGFARSQSTLDRAADRIEDENVRMAIKLNYVEDGETVAITGTALNHRDGKHSRMDVDTVFEEGETPFRQTKLQIGRDAWVGGKDVESTLPRGKHWVHFVESEDSVESLTMADFVQYLRYARTVEERGSGVIRGVGVTHYRGHADLREMVGEATWKRDFAARAIDGKAIVPVDAWIEDSGRLARIAIKTKLTDFAMSYTADVLELGPNVVVTTPPSEETIEEAEWDELTAE